MFIKKKEAFCFDPRSALSFTLPFSLCFLLFCISIPKDFCGAEGHGGYDTAALVLNSAAGRFCRSGEVPLLLITVFTRWRSAEFTSCWCDGPSLWGGGLFGADVLLTASAPRTDELKVIFLWLEMHCPTFVQFWYQNLDMCPYFYWRGQRPCWRRHGQYVYATQHLWD